MAASEPVPGILDGIRILDLSRGIPGEMAALQLYEAGAEVAKVEPPGGDLRRGTAIFTILNRGKRAVTLDLEQEGGRDQLQRLLAGADVLIHDFTPAEARRRGLDDARLMHRFPRLVVSAVTGWPANHAKAEAPPRETLVLASLGLLDEQPGHRDGPIFVRMPFASWTAGWLSLLGIVARLIARDRDGVGGVAHTSLAQGGLAPMTMHWARAETPSPVFARGLPKDLPIPLHQCSDGRWIHVHYSPDRAPLMAQGLAAMGQDAVARANAKFPGSHVAPNLGANRVVIATRPAEEWLRHFWEHDVSAQIAAPFGEIYFDEQARVNGYAVEVDDPRLGPTLQPGSPCKFDPPPRIGASFPRPGADNDRVFASWNLLAQPVADANASGRAPLDGINVLDLGAYVAGPFAGMMLADLGASVIEVEPPQGDAMRRVERAFAGAQRGKRGLAMKLGVPQTRNALANLVRWADVVHHNVRRPAALKLGIDYAALSALRPDIIHGHVSSYGPEGERADWPGFDQLFQAACGWELENGGAGNPPLWLRFGVTDHFAALASVHAVLLALYHRTRTGKGQAVGASLLGTALLTMSEALAFPDGSLTEIPHLDADQTGLSPEHRLYRCTDGWIAVAAIGPGEADRFRAVAGPEPEQYFAALEKGAAAARLAADGVPAEIVNLAQLNAFLDDPANAETRLRVGYQHGDYGRLEQIGALWNFGDLPLALDRPPPALGEHTQGVLREMGLSDDDIADLANQGLVALHPTSSSPPSPMKVT